MLQFFVHNSFFTLSSWHRPSPATVPLTCPSGAYQDQPGQSACQVCSAGQYCDRDEKCAFSTAVTSGNGTGTCPVACPAAAYLAFGNYTRERPCPAGYYCPAGTNFSQRYPCPVGTPQLLWVDDPGWVLVWVLGRV